MQGEIVRVCLSEQRGPKFPVEEACLVQGMGFRGDVHAGSTHRQVSLLSEERVGAFSRGTGSPEPGAFGENLRVRGIDMSLLGVGTLLEIGDRALCEVKQIGKGCVIPCEIGRSLGHCLMPEEGVFCVALQSGAVRAGMKIAVRREVSRSVPQAVCLTVSDRRSRGENADETGPLLKKVLEDAGWHVSGIYLAPDRQEAIVSFLEEWSEPGRTDVIFTAGGTGFSQRDVTPEATRSVLDREAPGLAEAMRFLGSQRTHRAWLSRGVAGIRGRTLIVNLPGSPKGARESLECVLAPLVHGVAVLRDSISNCAT